MGIINDNTAEFSYLDKGVSVLDFNVDEIPELLEVYEWKPSFEFTIDELDTELANIIIDASFSLFDNEKEQIAYFKTRNKYQISRFEKHIYPAEIVAVFLDRSIANSRAICAEKACENEAYYLPLIPHFTFKRLTEIASLIYRKSSLSDFSHERKEHVKIIEPIKETKSLSITNTNTIVNWFNPFDHNHPSAILAKLSTDAQEGNYTVKISVGKYYELISPDNWLLYIDWGIDVSSLAAITTRTTFNILGKQEDVFILPVIAQIAGIAFEEMMRVYREQLSIHQLVLDGDLKLSKESIDELAKGMLEGYLYILEEDKRRDPQLFKSGLTITKGENTMLVNTTVFRILDEILFLNPDFDHAHNIKLLQEANVPVAFYYTVKNKCLELENQKVELNLMHTIVFYLLLDLALQMLLGDQRDRLLLSLEQKNIGNFRQEEFITFGNDMFVNLKASLTKSGARFTNLENTVDWMERIR